MKILVTGGVRSGKSQHAEAMVHDALTDESLEHNESAVTYVAPGPAADPASDPDWAERILAHQQRRPAHWSTIETSDIPGALARASGTVLIDCLGTWLTAQLDRIDGWDRPRTEIASTIDAVIDDTAQAVARYAGSVVVVTNEVGMGVVPAHRSGRVFRDYLGTVNRRIADECDRVELVIAGRTITL